MGTDFQQLALSVASGRQEKSGLDADACRGQPTPETNFAAELQVTLSHFVSKIQTKC